MAAWCKLSNSGWTSQCFNTAHPCTKFSLWQPVRMTTRLYQNRMHTVKREPVRFFNFLQPSGINHFPTNDRTTLDFRPTSVCTRATEKRALPCYLWKKNTVADYRALVKKRVWPAFVIPAVATRIAAMWSCKSHSTYLVLNNMSKSLGRCTCRFEMRLLTIESAISSRLSERMATLFFPFGKFPMWYLILASLSADQCTHPGNCWQRLRHCQGNPSRIHCSFL